MMCIWKNVWILGSLMLALAAPAAVQAQYIVYSPPVVYSPPPVVTTSYYYAPAPVMTYYAPAPAYYAVPQVSYYAPVTVYSPPVVAGGYYTTRSYYGYGIFRPRGVYNETYYTPAVVPATSYYYRPRFAW